MSLTVAQLRTALKDSYNAKVQQLGLAESDVVTETDNGEALTDVVVGVCDTVRTVSPNNVKYPKIKT